MNKKKKGYLVITLFIIFIYNINTVQAKLDLSSLTDFSNIPKNYIYTTILLAILILNLFLGIIIGDNLVKNFNRIIKKEKITKSLIIEIIIILLIDIPLALKDIQTFSLCIKALAASLIFAPILDNYQENKDKDIYNNDIDNNKIKSIDKSITSESIKEYTFNAYKEIQKSYMYENYDKCSVIDLNGNEIFSVDAEHLEYKNAVFVQILPFS